MKTLGLVGKEVRTSKNPKKSPGEGSVLCYLISYEIIPSTVLFTCPQLTPLCSKTAVIDSYEIGELACHVSTRYGEGPFALLSFCSSWSVWTGLHFFWDSQDTYTGHRRHLVDIVSFIALFGPFFQFKIAEGPTDWDTMLMRVHVFSGPPLGGRLSQVCLRSL